MTVMTGMKKILITSDRPQNGSILSTTMVRGFPPRFYIPNIALTIPPEHYFDREAESNDPSFLSLSLNTLWSPPTEGVKVVRSQSTLL